jgi:hypothetical protein
MVHCRAGQNTFDDGKPSDLDCGSDYELILGL